MFYFKDNQELENLENVPTEYHVFYAKAADGKFRINDTMKATTANIDSLRTNMTTAQTNLTRANAESAERRTALEQFASLGTPAEVQAKLDDLTSKVTEGKKINPDTLRAEIKAQMQADIDASKKAALDMEGELKSVLIDDAITRSLIEHKGNPDLLSPVVKGRVGIIVDQATGKRMAVGINDKGEALPGADGGYMPVSKVVEGLKKDTKFAAAFEAPKQSGGGGLNGGPQRIVGSPAGQGGQGQGGDAPKSPVNKISAGLTARSGASG